MIPSDRYRYLLWKAISYKIILPSQLLEAEAGLLKRQQFIENHFTVSWKYLLRSTFFFLLLSVRLHQVVLSSRVISINIQLKVVLNPCKCLPCKVCGTVDFLYLGHPAVCSTSKLVLYHRQTGINSQLWCHQLHCTQTDGLSYYYRNYFYSILCMCDVTDKLN